MKKRPIALEDLFRIRVVGSAAISPDGTRIAFALKRADVKKNKNFANLYVVPTRGGRIRRLTTGDHVDSSPKWSPDGRMLAFLSNREKANCIYLLPMDGGEPERLTDRDSDVAQFSFSPDGRRIVYTARAKSAREKLQRDDKKDELAQQADFLHITRLFYKLDGSGFWNGNYTHVYTIGVGGGAARQLTEGPYDHANPQFSPDGKLVAFLSNRMKDPDKHPDNADIYVVPAGGGKARQLTTKEGPILNFAFSPNGKAIAFIGSFCKQGESPFVNAHVWLLPAAGGAPKNLTPRLDNNCYNVTLSDVAEITFQADPPAWSADGTRLFFTVSERGSCRLYAVSARGGDPRPVVAGDHMTTSMSAPSRDGRLALVCGTQTNPSDLFVVDPARPDTPPKQLTNVNSAALGGIAIAQPEEVNVSFRGRKLHGWVIKPPAFNPRRKYPLILEIHGGPFAQYGQGFFHEMQWLAANGYVVLFTNPSGSIGYGVEHVRRLRHKWGVADTPEVLACVEYVVRQGYIDRKRLYITGGSYGGFMTNWVLAHDHRFRAGVTQRCVYNMESMVAGDYGCHIAYEVGAFPWDDPKKTRAASPLAYVKKIKTPLLITHSELDHRCPIGQAEELFATLKWLGQDVEFVRFNGESHGLSRAGRPQNRAERLRRILDWFERHP